MDYRLCPTGTKETEMNSVIHFRPTSAQAAALETLAAKYSGNISEVCRLAVSEYIEAHQAEIAELRPLLEKKRAAEEALREAAAKMGS
jgi:hypothetical protein